MERLLHYVWQYKLYASPEQTTTEGGIFTILDPGIHNTDAGPDFFNAKLKCNETVWVGNIEIHMRASDWLRHGHHTDKAYDSVILHVVEQADAIIYRTNGEVIPQVELVIPDYVKQNYAILIEQARGVPCLNRLNKLSSFELSAWMVALLSERLERKTNDIYNHLAQHANDWSETFYIILCRSFGVGINSDAFEYLAKSLPLRILLKHRDQPIQVEALLFGQAGLLEDVLSDIYYQTLQTEYRFLQHKYQLKPVVGSLYKTMRIRPANFPHIKLAQLAALYVQCDTLFSRMIACKDAQSLRSLFRINPTAYWDTHYHFRCASTKRDKITGDNFLNIVLINTVAPLMYAYGMQYNNMELQSTAIELLEKLPAEINSITTMFKNAGCKLEHAGDSQALIQLKRMYCEQKKCLYCRIGFRLLSEK